jgi:hemolysin activation/secretion protein
MVSAQSAIKVPSQADIARQRVAPLPLPPIDYDFRIQNPERSAVPKAIDEIEFPVRTIRVVGAEHIPPSEVRAIFAPLEGRTILLEELRKAAQQLEDRYRAKGYFLTRVFVSPQQVKDGVLEVQVLEGYIGTAIVEAPNAPSRHHAEQMLAPVIDQHPAQFLDLESRLLLLNDVPGLTATSILRQGAVVGSSEMLVTATRVPNAYRASFSNTASSTLGPKTYGLGATLSQPLGRPGLLDIDISASGRKLEELRTANTRYAMPIGHRGVILAVGALLAKAKPGGAAAGLGLRSRIASMNARLRTPLLRTRPHSVYFDVVLTVNRSKTGITVPAGVQPLVDDRSTVAETSLTWQQAGWLNGATTVTVSLARGLEVLGANGRSAKLPSVRGFKPDFTKVNYSFQRTQIFTERLSTQFNLQGQYTGDRLAAGELTSFGGPAIGRGYDPSVLAGERGLGLAGEVQYALPVGIPGLIDGTKLYGFADWARSTSLATAADPKRNEYLSSFGAGLRTLVKSHLSIDMQLAQASRTVDTTARRGPRFNISAFLFF